MKADWRVAAVFIVLALGASSFWAGRTLEERARAAEALSRRQSLQESDASAQPQPQTYEQLPIAAILRLPFADFYEALRSAPRDARRKWSAELEQMPHGTERSTAFSAYYKLLAQFDPRGAIKDISEMKERSLQKFAFETVANAAPPFAMPELAEFALVLAGPNGRYPDGFYEVMRQWSIIDPFGAAGFIDRNRGERNNGCYSDVLFNLAAYDPEAAMKWFQAQNFRGDASNVKSQIIAGAYCHDRSASIPFTLNLAGDPEWQEAAVSLFATLYLDDKEEAKRFFEHLPNADAKQAAMKSLEWVAESGTVQEIGRIDRTPRAVAEWITQFPPEYWKGELSPTLKRWSSTSVEEVVAWIAQRPPEIRDAVADEFAVDTETTLHARVRPVLTLPNDDLRDRLLRVLFQNMIDPVEYAESIHTSALPESLKRHVLKVAQEVASEQASEAREAIENYGSEK